VNRLEGATKPTPIWTPSHKRVREASVTHFIESVNNRYGLNIKTYSQLYDWSIAEVSDFWSAIWDHTGIVCSRRFDRVVEDLDEFPGAKWFSGARLNFAENLLKHRDGKLALIRRSEGGARSVLTHSELYWRVGALASCLRKMGVQSGDRVAGYMSNIEETTVAMLAATSIGALWACCGAEIGPGAALDRLGQIEPRLLFAVDGYRYKGREFDILPNIEKVARGIPSIEKIVIVPELNAKPSRGEISNFLRFDDLVSPRERLEVRFEQLPADHPVYIMFSSGTTGKPKCLVQGAAGLLVNQLKEILLHTDLKNTDNVTYITSPSWMMWNWLMSCLATGASVVLYDGNPNYPDWRTIWQLVEEEKITVMGCSASYINYLRSLEARPGRVCNLSSLREVSQTG